MKRDTGLQIWAHLLLPGLAQDGMRLDADALHRVHHHQRAIAQARRRADLAAEVHMPRRVYQVDQMPCMAPSVVSVFRKDVSKSIVRGKVGEGLG